ncbi:MAG: hypothetical protein ACJ8HI_20820, partial [Massilia sp.]
MRHPIAFSIIATAITLYAGFAMAEPASGGTLSCGLGLPPGAPGFAAAQAQQALEVKKNGYLKMCDANLERYRITFRPFATTIPSLAFKPVDLSGTPFAHFRFLGGRSEVVNNQRSRLYRGFRTPEGHTVT